MPNRCNFTPMNGTLHSQDEACRRKLCQRKQFGRAALSQLYPWSRTGRHRRLFNRRVCDRRGTERYGQYEGAKHSHTFLSESENPLTAVFMHVNNMFTLVNVHVNKIQPPF